MLIHRNKNLLLPCKRIPIIPLFITLTWCLLSVTNKLIWIYDIWADKSVILSNNEWYFFCPRGRKYPKGLQTKRGTDSGYWKVTGKERNVKSGTRVVGTKRTLVFHKGRAPKGTRTEWIMHEYSMSGTPKVYLKATQYNLICSCNNKLKHTKSGYVTKFGALSSCYSILGGSQ